MKRSVFDSLFDTSTRRRRKRSSYAIETLAPRVMLSADNSVTVASIDSDTSTVESRAAETHDYPTEAEASVGYPNTPEELIALDANDETPAAADAVIQPELLPMVRDLFGESSPNDAASLIDFSADDVTVSDASFTSPAQPSQSSVESTLTPPFVSFIAEQIVEDESAVDPKFDRLDPFDQQQAEERTVDTDPQAESSNHSRPGRQSESSDATRKSTPKESTDDSRSTQTAQLDDLDRVFANPLLPFSLIELPTPPVATAAR